MATHSSVLAWRIPGTGEPGGLLSMGSHRVRHDWSDLAAAAARLATGAFSIPFLMSMLEAFSVPFLTLIKLLHKSSWVIKPGPWSWSYIFFFRDHESDTFQGKLSFRPSHQKLCLCCGLCSLPSIISFMESKGRSECLAVSFHSSPHLCFAS